MTMSGDEMIGSMLALLESGNTAELIRKAWRMLYDVIIPYETPDMEHILGAFVVLLRNTLGSLDSRAETEKLLSIVDLIIHPRRQCIAERPPTIAHNVEPVKEDRSAELKEPILSTELEKIPEIVIE